jgi:iron(III) transport system permease protein
VENNDYGLAIAYSTVLIFVMLGAVALLQLLVSERRLGRRGAAGGVAVTGGG